MTGSNIGLKHARRALLGSVLAYSAAAVFSSVAKSPPTEREVQQQAYKQMGDAQRKHSQTMSVALDEVAASGRPSLETCGKIRTSRQDFFTNARTIEDSLNRLFVDNAIKDIDMTEAMGSLTRLKGLMDAPVYQVISNTCK